MTTRRTWTTTTKTEFCKCEIDNALNDEGKDMGDNDDDDIEDNSSEESGDDGNSRNSGKGSNGGIPHQ